MSRVDQVGGSAHAPSVSSRGEEGGRETKRGQSGCDDGRLDIVPWGGCWRLGSLLVEAELSEAEKRDSGNSGELWANGHADWYR